MMPNESTSLAQRSVIAINMKWLVTKLSSEACVGKDVSYTSNINPAINFRGASLITDIVVLVLQRIEDVMLALFQHQSPFLGKSFFSMPHHSFSHTSKAP